MNGGRQRVESNVAGFSSRFLETTSNAFRGSRPNFSESESRREESFSLEISLYFSSFLFERLPPPLLPLDSRNGTEAHLHLADRLSRYSHASIKLRHNWILGRGGRQIYERCPPPSRIKILERSARENVQGEKWVGWISRRGVAEEREAKGRERAKSRSV